MSYPTLRSGDRGEEVGVLHQVLIEDGYPVAREEMAAMRFGPSTYALVVEFQSRNRDGAGHPLVRDGVVGEKTWFALGSAAHSPNRRGRGPTASLEGVSSLVKPVIEAAIGELGDREEPAGSNSGPLINKFGQQGQPWCAYFVSWCYAHAPGGSPFGRIGSVQALHEWAITRGRVVPEAQIVMSGDIFVIRRTASHGHTGLVVAAQEDATFQTIEGNSSDAVRCLERLRAEVTAIVRPFDVSGA